MKKDFFIPIVALAIIFVSCEGKEIDGYDNAGLTQDELAHTRALIDSSLSKVRTELYVADSLTKSEMRAEIKLLKEEIKKLKKQ